MEQTSEDVCGISIFVMQRNSVELQFVYSQYYSVARHGISASVRLYRESSVSNHQSGKIQLAERSVEFHLAIAL